MPTQLMLDLLITVLLTITVGYCFLLNRRLSALRSGQDGLREIIRNLNEATGRAQSGIEQLRRTSESIGHELTSKIKHGRELADELAMIVESGNNIANRMTAGAVKTSTTGRNVNSFPNPLTELARVDKAFRRHHENEPETAPARAASLINKSVPDDGADDLRQALRAVR